MICAECIRLLLVVDYWNEQSEQTREAPQLAGGAVLLNASDTLERLRDARRRLDSHQRGHAATIRTAYDSYHNRRAFMQS